MKNDLALLVSTLAICFIFSCVSPANASLSLGKGNSSLLGGDLTDPEDDVIDHGSYAGNGSEEDLRPQQGDWVTMKSAPNTKPGQTGHELHSYHNWQNSPPCAIFLNNPEGRKWYIGFLDGGNGGPTEAEPYFCAVELKAPVALTHFTMTMSGDMPGRDPRQWAIQGSETGKDGEWTDIYKCDAKDRSGTPFQENGRLETFLFTSFTSANISRICTAPDVKKIEAKLDGKKIEKEDFPVQTKSYKWLRVVIYSCFNANSMTYEDFNHPPGFNLGQLELFGAPPMKVIKKIGEPVRTWAAKNGSKIDAAWTELRGDTLTLRKKDGKPAYIRIPLLSEADQQYVAQSGSEAPKPKGGEAAVTNSLKALPKK